MEEYIMILESECYYLEELGYLRENNHFIRFNQALKNLIKAYKNLEQIEQVHKETNGELRKRITELEENNSELNKGIKRLKDKNKELSNELIDVKVDKVTKNYISKSKVEEKIKELKNKIEDYKNMANTLTDRVDKRIICDQIEELKTTIKYLQELLEE